MKNTILLLTLLFSVNAFADDPAWWSDSKCREQRNKDYASLMLHGFKSHDAVKKIDEEFKICVCSSGDEARVAVQALADNHEIEMMSNDGVITVAIKYGRDFGMMAYKGQCYLNVGKPELCKNSAFMGEAKQSFNVYETYDEKTMYVLLISTNKINQQGDNMSEENCMAMLEYFSIRIAQMNNEIEAFKKDEMISIEEKKAEIKSRLYRIRALQYELLYLKLI